MWTIEESEEFRRRRKRYERKHPRELAAVLDNLDTFHRALNLGALPQQAKFGFIHPEPHGVLAIDQKGGGPHLAQTRLYVYPDRAGEVLHLLNLGDKRTQASDIKTCTELVAQIRERGRDDHGQEERDQEGHGQEGEVR